MSTARPTAERLAEIRKFAETYSAPIAEDVPELLAEIDALARVNEAAGALMLHLNESPNECAICGAHDDHEPDMPCGVLWDVFGSVGATVKR